ncbi:probable LRR receptor-like serine/threonine-protein kinase At1g53430 [Ziziphus jujuba]|uniref:non-specific serine/threonine protein kinase n=1 Tax=Ziziphus jujuba TaxID=326968 RepID=A0ABM4ABN8_ZIZJJ|nr:probable LRR receptor-like serine/threonine-protein kinase At1g53430 [Ziziphus jujuba]
MGFLDLQNIHCSLIVVVREHLLMGINDNETSQFFISPKGNWAYSNSGGFLSTSLNSSDYIKRGKCGISVADAPLYEKARLSPTSLKYYGVVCVKVDTMSHFILLKLFMLKTLHFAEIVYAEDEEHSSSMKRIFHVDVQGERQLTDFNIKESAGGLNKIIVKTNLTANVADNGVLEIHLHWAGKGSTVDLSSSSGNHRTRSSGPLISAITVTPEFKIKRKKLSPLEISMITLASIVFAALLLLALAWAMGGFRKEELHEINVGQEKPVTLKQLKDATGKFSKEMEIGKGGLVKGAPGQFIGEYVALEYLMYGTISYKYDVYGYGVVILEILCGRRNAEQKLNKDELEYLVDEVVVANSQGRLREMVDKNFLGYDEKEAITILKLAVRCINISTSFKPTMSEVVSVLTGEKTIDDIWKPDSTQNLCQNCIKSLHEDDGVVELRHA